MKKNLLTFLTMIAFSLNAQQVIDFTTGEILSDADLLPPNKNVEYLEDGIVVSYQFFNAQIYEDDIYKNSYILRIPGFSNNCQLKLPGTPNKIESYIIPAESEYFVSVISSKYIDVECVIAPGRTPKFMGDTTSYKMSTVPPIDAYSKLWPQEICENIEQEVYRTQTIANIKINPVQYNYEKKIVRLYSEIVYKVQFISENNMSNIYFEPGSLFNPNCTLNSVAFKKGTKTYSSIREPGTNIDAKAGYIIISVPEFESTLAEFIKWKKRLGYNVTALYDSNWTYEKIKSAVQECYNNDNSLMYLLIVGDHSKVPAQVVKFSSTYGDIITDLSYGCVTGNDNMPDIYRGRWPISNQTDLETIINKTIWYEQAPPLDNEFYKRATHFSFFEDGTKDRNSFTHDGIEDSRFVKSCEDIRDTLVAHHGYIIDRFYNVDSVGLRFWPSKWSSVYANGGNLPNELLYENGFSWDYCATDVVDAVNEGVSYVMFSGHGGHDAWGDGKQVLFTTEDINNMWNYERLPIVFNICCSTGKHSEPICLTRSFLSKKNGGAVGAFAATNVGYYDTHGKSMSLFFNAIWPNPGFTMYGDICDISDYISLTNIKQTGSIRQLGSILDFMIFGFRKNDRSWLHNRRVYHCFGDPSMYFRTESPEILDDKVDVQHTGSGTHVSVYDKDAYIAFYDPIKDKSTRCYGNEAAYFTDDKDGGKYVDVVVYTPNSVPVIVYGEDYYGEITEPAEESRIVGYHDPRDHSRVDIKYYLNSKDAKKSVEMLIVDLATNNIISSAPVDKSITNQVTSISMRCHGGVMVASLMIDRYPVSNMKMYISK